MTVRGLIFMNTGFLMEAIWLYNNSHKKKPRNWQRYFLWIEGSILILALTLAGLVNNGNTIVSDDNYIGYSFIFAFISFFWIYDNLAFAFLPLVSEQSILVVQFVVLISMFQSNIHLPSPLLLCFVIFSIILMLYLTIRKTVISPGLKILVYFWYLILLVLQWIFSEQFILISNVDLDLSGWFFTGVFLCFICVHLKFVFLFFKGFYRVLFPKDGEFFPVEIPSIFLDDQVSPLSFLVFMSSTVSATYLLYHFQVPQAGLWVNMMIIFIIQVLFNPYINSWFKYKLNLVD